jgi:nitrite reductase/ring-hydroxylating ferredoxin subunit/catechol 2,3-dioxygenase-like lactoylglutathione lyase family enzyme
MISAIRAVTVSTTDLTRAQALYSGALGFSETATFRLDRSAGERSAWHRLWDLPADAHAEGRWLEQRGATSGAVRLVRFSGVPQHSVAQSARPFDHGRVKNLDFFTNDVQREHDRLEAAGHRFMAPPGSYEVGWGPGSVATEAHLVTAEGTKVALARLAGAPRTAFGDAAHGTPCTEVAAATQIVADYDRAVAFYQHVFDCVPAVDTVVDNPALASTLALPPETRLRLCFIGPAPAVGGKIGLVAYEGPGRDDVRSLAADTRPPHVGVVALTFVTDALEIHLSRALLHPGATLVAGPLEADTAGVGPGRVATILSPDGVLHELVEPTAMTAGAFEPLAMAAPALGGLAGGRTADGRRVVVANVEGQLFALEDRCPHLGGPLSTGVLRGRTITCPWHGWGVDVTTGSVRGCRAVAATGCAVRRDGARVLVAPPHR